MQLPAALTAEGNLKVSLEEGISEVASAVEALIENAVDAGNLTHTITVAEATGETLIVEIAKTGIYAFSAFFDLDNLEAAAEGTTVSLRLFNKIDGANYSDKPSAIMIYTISASAEYPSVEAAMLHGNCKITIQLASAVTQTRTIAYRYITRDLGA